jgi:hypothetical protein
VSPAFSVIAVSRFYRVTTMTALTRLYPRLLTGPSSSTNGPRALAARRRLVSPRPRSVARTQIDLTIPAPHPHDQPAHPRPRGLINGRRHRQPPRARSKEVGASKCRQVSFEIHPRPSPRASPHRSYARPSPWASPRRARGVTHRSYRRPSLAASPHRAASHTVRPSCPPVRHVVRHVASYLDPSSVPAWVENSQRRSAHGDRHSQRAAHAGSPSYARRRSRFASRGPRAGSHGPILPYQFLDRPPPGESYERLQHGEASRDTPPSCPARPGAD